MNLRPATALRETSGPTTLVNGAMPDGQFAKRSGTGLVGAALGAADLPAYVPTFLALPKTLPASMTLPTGYNAVARAPLVIPAGTKLTIQAGAKLECLHMPDRAGDVYVGFDPDALAPQWSGRLLRGSQEFCRDQSRGSWTVQKNTAQIGVAGSAIVPGGLELLFPPTVAGAFSGIYASQFPTNQEFAVLMRFDVDGATPNFTYLGMCLFESAAAAGDIYQAGIRAGSATPTYGISQWTSDTVQGADIATVAGPSYGPTYVLMKVRANHVTTWIGASPDGLMLMDLDRTLTFTPAFIGFGGYSSGPTTARAARVTLRYCRVVPEEYSTLTTQYATRVNGARIYLMGA